MRSVWSTIWQAMTAPFTRRALERDFRDELADHLARDIEFRMRHGATADEARRAAHATLGSVAATRDELRDVHTFTALDNVRRDLVYAARRLRRNPGYAAVMVTTIALGVGATTAVFGAVDGVLLKSLPFPEPQQLVTLWQSKLSAGLERDDVAPRTFLDWTEQTKSYSALAAANPYSVNYRTSDRTETVEAWLVTNDFFRVVDVRPALGRTFRDEDFHSGSARVALLDHAFWQARFGADPNIVGRSVTFDDEPYTIVGVMPRGFEIPERTSVWRPWALDSAQREDRFGSYIKVFGRLRPGVDVGSADAELSGIAKRLEAQYPRSNTGVGARVIPLRDVMIGGRAPLLWMLLGASLLLLGVTVANVSALHLTRLTRQRQETAVRAALGASRARLARPLIAEGAWLAALGGAAGAAVAWLGIRLIHTFGPADLPRLQEIRVDARLIVVAFALAAASAVVLAAMSLARLRRGQHALAVGARHVAGSPSGLRARRAAVGIQLALALVLLVGTSLLVRSFLAVLSEERGYRTDHLLSFTTWVYDEYPTVDLKTRYVADVLERVGALPGASLVSMGSALPLADAITGERADVVIDGASVAVGEEPEARGVVVWPGYFETLGIAVRGGRALATTDDERAERVVVVNEAFSRRFSPDRDVVGRMVKVGLMSGARPRRIVGVVADTRDAGLDEAPKPAVYIPWRQQPLGALTFLVRTSAEPASMVPAVQRTLFELDPRIGVARMATLDELVDGNLRERRFLLLLLGGFAAIAVLLACVGVAGVMAQTVVERRREIGVRMALGATPAAIRSQLLGEAGRLSLWGLTAGTLVALGATRLLASFLYGVSTHDVAGFAGAAAMLGALAVIAALLPSVRATREDPARVLGTE